MSAFSNIIIDLLDFIGVMLDIPPSLLGLTLLAIGNSIPDLTLDCSLAMTGYGEMAISGTIAAPLFNLLIGFGISLIRKNLNEGVVNISFFSNQNLPSVVAYLLLFFNLITSLAVAYKNNFKFTKGIAIRALIIFILYIIALVLVSLFW